MFSRVPLILVTGLFLLALTVYYDGARNWLLHRKSRRVRLALALDLFVLGLMSLLVVPSVLLCMGVCEALRRLRPLRGPLDRFRRRRPQLALSAVVVGVPSRR